jgi:hypothetical protein
MAANPDLIIWGQTPKREMFVAELNVKYWTNRWDADAGYRIEHTDTGWIFHAVAHSGPTDTEGSPHLLGNFHQDYVSFPHGVDGYLGYIWTRLHHGEIDEIEAQRLIDELFEWVSQCERSRPKWRGWNC